MDVKKMESFITKGLFVSLSVIAVFTVSYIVSIV